MDEKLRRKIIFYAKQGRSRNQIYDALTQAKPYYVFVKRNGQYRLSKRYHRTRIVTRREVQEVMATVPLAERREARRLYWESKEDKICELQKTLQKEYGLNNSEARRAAISLIRDASDEALKYRHDAERKEEFEEAMQLVHSPTNL